MMQTAPKTTMPVFNASPISVSKSFFRFGDQLITLEKYGSDESRNYVLVSLHGNELSSLKTALHFAQEKGAAVYRLKHKETRLVEADLHDQKVRFDPNKIFTCWGRRVHLKANNCYSRFSLERVEQLSKFVVNELRWDKTVVSLNNSEGRLSINDYRHGRLEKEVKELNVSPSMDPYDYFVTAEESIYQKLKARNFNVVLQHHNRIKDNGSLSLYLLRSDRAFVNVETKADHTSEEERMLEALDGILK